MSRSQQVLQLLAQLESEMHAHNLWGNSSPTQAELSSTQPFAIDKLSPEQWLQWIFIVRIRQLCEQNLALPELNISPYFEECWKEHPHLQQLLKLIKKLESH